MMIKYFEGDIQDLGLFFCVDEPVENGKSERIELVKNGSELQVTNENRLQYIMLYGNYMLNLRT